ncbi:CAP domain-containing protein [Halobacillus litoralis]|uniref:CAP domain-containing protein n=1 Tax=Halobacillus litoralis TaxID=45668 RepID=UPI001CFEDD4E|nr:CAP domain-containing protein [Halobacillus litoralis]
MIKKSLMVSGALALSLLASPATSLASTGDIQQNYKVETKTVQIDSGQIQDWVHENENALKSKDFQQINVQSLLDQFQWNVQQPPEAPSEQSQSDEPKQEVPAEEEQKQEASAPEAEPAPAPEQPAEKQVQQKEDTEVQASSEVSAFEKQVVELTNQERAKQGLEPLELDTELSAVAKDKSLDMQQNNYFSHNSPTYGSPFDMMKQYGIDYRTAGENIAMGQTSPEQVVEGWMNSEGHRKNIMNPDFTHIGVGHAENGNYWTQMFIGK